MKRISLLLVLLVLCGCKEQPNAWVVRHVPTTQEERKVVAEMVVKLCEVSNPKSDEEPEDMIAQAETTACRVLCRPTMWEWGEYRETGKWRYVEDVCVGGITNCSK